MREGPDIARIAAVIGHPARANMINHLMGGMALTAKELAEIAGVTPPTASEHLGKLEASGLVSVRRQGRHRYYALAGEDIALLVESILVLADRLNAHPFRPGPRDPQLRRARTCYNHLAGELAVSLFERFSKVGGLVMTDCGICLSDEGCRRLAELGGDLNSLAPAALSVRSCLDWSERRPHLGGKLGALLLARMMELGWLRRASTARIMSVTPRGELHLAKLFT